MSIIIDLDLWVFAIPIDFSAFSMNSKGIEDLFSYDIYEKSCNGSGIGDYDYELKPAFDNFLPKDMGGFFTFVGLSIKSVKKKPPPELSIEGVIPGRTDLFLVARVDAFGVLKLTF